MTETMTTAEENLWAAYDAYRAAVNSAQRASDSCVDAALRRGPIDGVLMLDDVDGSCSAAASDAEAALKGVLDALERCATLRSSRV